MSEVVQYILDLKSNQFDSALTTATAKTTTLNSAMSGLASTAAMAFSAFAAYNFISGSIDAFNESDQALAQLNATLKSTHGSLGLTTEAIQEQAKAMQQLTVFDDDAVISMQSVLATFTQVKGEIFTNAVPAILDLSTKMGQDLKSSAVQVGKALNDPIAGITALRRVGVSFTDDQKKVIESLVQTGRVAEAQKIILAELNTEFGGSAQAAAAAGTGPWKQLQNAFGDVREDVGELALTIGKDLLPVIKSLVSGASDMVKWMKESGSEFKATAFAVGTLVVGLQVAIPVMAGMGVATSAMLGPLALVTASVYMLVDGYNTMMNTAQQWQNMQKNFDERANANQRKALQDDFQRYKMQGLSDELAFKKSIASEEAALIQLNTSLQEKFNKAKDSGTQNMLIEQINQAKQDQKNLEDLKNEGVKSLQAPAPKNTASTSSAMVKSPKIAKDNTKTQAVGQKSITINVSINDIAKGFTIVTNNVQQGAAKIKEQVTSALVSSINDFQNLALD
jgi:hypothetical protein